MSARQPAGNGTGAASREVPAQRSDNGTIRTGAVRGNTKCGMRRRFARVRCTAMPTAPWRGDRDCQDSVMQRVARMQRPV